MDQHKLYAYNCPIDKTITLYMIIVEHYDALKNTVCCKWIPSDNFLSIISLSDDVVKKSIHIGHVRKCNTHMVLLLSEGMREIEDWETPEITDAINEYIGLGR